jgi:hypothetical protein
VRLLGAGFGTLMVGGAPAAVKAFAAPHQALFGVQNPGAILPGRLVAQVLSMAAGQDCQPIAVLVLTEIKQTHWAVRLRAVRFRACPWVNLPALYFQAKGPAPC